MVNENYIYLIIFLFLSCNQTNNNKINLREEQKVINDVFSTLLFEMKSFDSRKRMPPPPPPPAPRLTEGEKNRFLENHKTYLDTTEFAPLYLVVNDSIIGYSKKWLKRWYKEDKRLKFIDTTYIKKSFKIDLSGINLSKNYNLKYKSELELPIEELKNKERLKYPIDKKHLWQYMGILYVHQVYFNKEKDYGVLQVGYNCGKLCGCGYIVFVKKVGDRWEIDEIESTGCA